MIINSLCTHNSMKHCSLFGRRKCGVEWTTEYKQRAFRQTTQRNRASWINTDKSAPYHPYARLEAL